MRQKYELKINKTNSILNKKIPHQNFDEGFFYCLPS
jgi:hypothetical protein